MTGIQKRVDLSIRPFPILALLSTHDFLFWVGWGEGGVIFLLYDAEVALFMIGLWSQDYTNNNALDGCTKDIKETCNPVGSMNLIMLAAGP